MREGGSMIRITFPLPIVEQRVGRKAARRWKRELLAKLDARCFWCDRPLSLRGFAKATLDHVFPVSRGGDASQVVLCCDQCNVLKDNMLPEEWLQRLEHVCDRLRALVDFV